MQQVRGLAHACLRRTSEQLTASCKTKLTPGIALRHVYMGRCRGPRPQEPAQAHTRWQAGERSRLTLQRSQHRGSSISRVDRTLSARCSRGQGRPAEQQRIFVLATQHLMTSILLRRHHHHGLSTRCSANVTLSGMTTVSRPGSRGPPARRACTHARHECDSRSQQSDSGGHYRRAVR